MTTVEKAEIIKQIVELQRRINRGLRGGTLEAWMKLNLTIPQLKSLFFIANEVETNFTKLARALKVTAPNVTGIIDRLIEQGLVSRQENPDDRRMLILRVTDEGEDIVAKLRERRASYLSGILSHLSMRELESVSKGLSLIVRAAEIHGRKPAINVPRPEGKASQAR